MNRFTNARDVIKHIDGALPICPALVDAALNKKDSDRSLANPRQITPEEAESVDRHLAVKFNYGC